MRDTSPVDALLASAEPFRNDDADVLYTEDEIRALEGSSGAEAALIAAVRDETGPLARRFAAVEALLQASFAGWRAQPEDVAAVLRVAALAIPRDEVHNRWGLPGHFVGRTSAGLLALGGAPADALAPLLDVTQPLHIDGSEAAAVQHQSRYRVCDLAGYLIATALGLGWTDDPDPRRRDGEIQRVREAIQAG